MLVVPKKLVYMLILTTHFSSNLFTFDAIQRFVVNLQTTVKKLKLNEKLSLVINIVIIY